MSTANKTFILFGQADQSVAQRDPSFGQRLRKAFTSEYMTKEKVVQKLMGYCWDESDNHSFTDDGKAIQECASYNHDTEVATYNTIMEQGDMSYEHDGRTWEFIELNELDERDAVIVLKDGVLFDDGDKEVLYNKFPDLRPVESEQD